MNRYDEIKGKQLLKVEALTSTKTVSYDKMAKLPNKHSMVI